VGRVDDSPLLVGLGAACCTVFSLAFLSCFLWNKQTNKQHTLSTCTLHSSP